MNTDNIIMNASNTINQLEELSIIPTIKNKDNVSLYISCNEVSYSVDSKEVDDFVRNDQLWIIENRESDNTSEILLDRVSSKEQGKSYLKNLTFCGSHRFTYLHIKSLHHCKSDDKLINIAKKYPKIKYHVRQVDRLFKKQASTFIDGQYDNINNLTFCSSRYTFKDNMSIIKVFSNEAYNKSMIVSKIAKNSFYKACTSGKTGFRKLHTEAAINKRIKTLKANKNIKKLSKIGKTFKQALESPLINITLPTKINVFKRLYHTKLDEAYIDNMLVRLINAPTIDNINKYIINENAIKN